MEQRCSCAKCSCSKCKNRTTVNKTSCSSSKCEKHCTDYPVCGVNSVHKQFSTSVNLATLGSTPSAHDLVLSLAALDPQDPQAQLA